ncbi:APC family permease [Nitratiruptor tergarcus]|uniref:L-asparagine transporter n=1 Tax=Nitratiruptor tergarcus DSM 16512 TaxID=1069081 RepID=A0A1W1WST4_9BACT|nr:APC family permease [Nitratiruptor tergarcus]SMC08783.1 L-asparagine transporter [Nitratiruptor tergarcus DSM 16512]
MRDKLGLKELVAIGIGSMIGGGIFSVMGVADEIAGHATVLVFVIGGIIALFAGYNYAKLALAYKVDGASYIYLKYAFPKTPAIAAITGWSVIVGYIGTLALYAYTFGSYGAAMLGYADNYLVRSLLAFGILTLFLWINLLGIKEMGESEDVIVFFKVAIMMTMGIIGLFYLNPSHFQPLFDKSFSGVLLSAALVFVAFEGFQLITNSVAETENPDRNTPLSIYLSIIIVTLIYVVLAIAVIGILTPQEIKAAKEYAIAEALKPILGEWGFVLASIAAMLATSSAINGTLFGASRMMADIAKDGIFPSILSYKNAKTIPSHALLAMYVLATLFVLYGSLDSIIAFSSMTFLLVSLAVAIANTKLYRQTNSSLIIILLSITLMSITVSLMIYYLFENEPKTLFDIAMIYGLIIVSFTFYYILQRKRLKR